jgi:NAD(P)-dependent dehydrogenase (short-subunit alcohol dehydrogenase family)
MPRPARRAGQRGRDRRGRHWRQGGCHPHGRQATGREITYAALFFISDESVYVTGQTLAVDSGLTGIS